MNKDSYGEIINGPLTYMKIAQRLVHGHSVLIGWTDGCVDHRDILFTYDADCYIYEDDKTHTIIKAGDNLQRGMRWCNLFVSIIDFNAYGFVIEDKANNKKDNGYIKEKLRLNNNRCDDCICDLINGVIEQIDILEGRFNETI